MQMPQFCQLIFLKRALDSKKSKLKPINHSSMSPMEKGFISLTPLIIM